MSDSHFLPFIYEDMLFKPTRRVARPIHHHRSFAAPPQPMSTPNALNIRETYATHFSENDELVTLSVDLPGVKASNIQVVVQDGVLSVVAVRKVKSSDGHAMKKYKLEKKFSVDTSTIDVAQAKANLSSGVLVVKVPKLAKKAPISIPVTNDEEQEEEEDDDEQEAINVEDDDDEEQDTKEETKESSKLIEEEEEEQEEEDSKVPAKAVKIQRPRQTY